MSQDLLNKAACKRFILAKVESLRPGWKATRVSKEALDALEAKIRTIIVAQVQSHPTLGQTFRP